MTNPAPVAWNQEHVKTLYYQGGERFQVPAEHRRRLQSISDEAPYLSIPSWQEPCGAYTERMWRPERRGGTQDSQAEARDRANGSRVDLDVAERSNGEGQRGQGDGPPLARQRVPQPAQWLRRAQAEADGGTVRKPRHGASWVVRARILSTGAVTLIRRGQNAYSM